MSWNAYFNKRTVYATVCAIAVILILKTIKPNSKNLNLRSSYIIQPIYNKLMLHKLFHKHAKDIKESREFITMFNMTKENKEDYKCVSMTVDPPTKVCLHDLQRDDCVSTFIVNDGAWERQTLAEFKGELMKDNKLGVIDIGANIGVYTLYAATMGRNVVSVEPFLENVQRIHKAAILGRVNQNIVLLQNAIADKRDTGMLKLSSTNQGLTKVITKDSCFWFCPPTVKTILLSDLRYIATFERAIMKIDIQGHEALAFATIELLIDQISIPTIFMEWEFFHPNNKPQLDYERVCNLLRVMTKLGYIPYHLKEKNGTMLNIMQHRSWPYDIVWRKNPKKVH